MGEVRLLPSFIYKAHHRRIEFIQHIIHIPTTIKRWYLVHSLASTSTQSTKTITIQETQPNRKGPRHRLKSRRMPIPPSSSSSASAASAPQRAPHPAAPGPSV